MGHERQGIHIWRSKQEYGGRWPDREEEQSDCPVRSDCRGLWNTQGQGEEPIPPLASLYMQVHERLQISDHAAQACLAARHVAPAV